MDERPDISVVLPVHNGAETLSKSIESIQKQTHTNWELLVVDDGSDDESPQIAAAAAARDRRIHVVSQAHGGIVVALHMGCREARGRLIARMDADDRSRPERLARQRAWFEANPSGGLCGTQVAMAGESIRAGRRRYESWLNALTSHADIERELFIECPIAHPAFMMRRDAYEALGGYRDTGGPEDYDLVFRFWQAGYRLGNVPETLLDWYESSDRLSMRSKRYSEAAFRGLKRTWLRTCSAGAGRPLYQWGAGEVGKRWLREWPTGAVRAVVDIRPGKIGQTIHGYTVIRPDDLPPPRACYFLIAVGTPGARQTIRAWCAKQGYIECRDFRFIA